MRRPALVLTLACLVAGACMHDWDRYDVDGAEGEGEGEGGAPPELSPIQQDSCDTYCRAHELCGTTITSCASECAKRIVDCSDETGVTSPADDVGDCAESYQPLTGCDQNLLTACLLAEAPCF